MFKIFDGREYFYQWDIDRKLIVSDSSVEEVHFCNRFTNYSLVVEPYELEGVTVVDVPNIILQESLDIHVYAYDEKYTKFDDTFKVKPRTRPADYVYTQEEIKVWDEMEQKVIHLEYLLGENGLAEAIAEYMEANPVQPGASTEEAAQIEQNKTDIAELQEAASTHATTEYVDEAIGAIPPVDFTGYATEEFVDKKIAAAQLEDAEADLEAYYTKSEVDAKVKETADAIPSVEGLASETYVNEAIAAIPPVSFEGYATEEYVGEQIAAIPPVDFTGYATEAFVEAAIEDIPEVDLSDYALKSELPSTVGLASEEYVNQQIEAIPDVDLTGYAKETYVDEKIAAIPAPDYSGLATEGYVDEKVGAIVIPEVPTKVSAFENDANYLTEHQSLENYYTKEEVDGAITEAGSAIEVDGLTIIQNEDGTISTTIGGSIIDVYGKTYAEYSGVERGYSTYGYIFKNQFLTDNTTFYADAEVGKEYWLIHTITTRPDEKFIVKATLESINEDSNGIGYAFAPIEASEYISDFGIVWTDASTTKGVLYMYPSNSFDTENDKVDSAILCEPITKGISHIKVEAVPVDGSTIVVNENDTIEVNKEMFATKEEIPSLEGYAKTTDIPDVSGYQTAEQVSAAITAAAPDLTGYATTGYVDEAVGAIDIPETDLSNYYTKEETDTAISESAVDTSAFVSKTDRGLGLKSISDDILVKETTVGDTDGAMYRFHNAIQVVDLSTAWTKLLEDRVGVTPHYGYSLTFTQEDLDAHGIELGWDFINDKELTAPKTINGGYNTVIFIHNKKMYMTQSRNATAAANVINYFNRIWYDNTTSGLTATDIPAAINELAAIMPEAVDLSNYYTKTEVDTAISEAGGGATSSASTAIPVGFRGMFPFKRFGATDTVAFADNFSAGAQAFTEAEFWSGLTNFGSVQLSKYASEYNFLPTNEILDANGWKLGYNFTTNNNLSYEDKIALDTGFICVDGYLYMLNWKDATQKLNLLNYFNRFWYDNTTSGLASTDIKAAIDELASKTPDLTNYYTKTETEAFINEVINNFAVAEEGTY